MDLSKLISDAKAKAQADPSYIITPSHAKVIEYRIQCWTQGSWKDLVPAETGLDGFSQLKKEMLSLKAIHKDREFRMIAIAEVS